MSEILDDFPEARTPLKDRHGCVTAWLVLMLVGNSLASVVNLLFGSAVVQNASGLSSLWIWALGAIGILNVIFVFKLFKWKKIGFYGFLMTTVLSLVISLIVDVVPLQALIGLAGIAVLHKLLQMKTESGRRAWSNLE